MRKKIKVRFLFIYVFRKYMFVCNFMGNGSIEGIKPSILKHKKGLLLKNAPYFFFLIFPENITLLSLNTIKLILLGDINLKSIKSRLSPCDYTRVFIFKMVAESI